LLIGPGLLVAVVAAALAGRSVSAARPGAVAVAVAAASAPGDAPITVAAADPQRPAFRPQDDAPFARVPLVNRFTIDDVRPGWSSSDNTGSRRGRRLGGIANYRADPYER
jgi:hypothetical protein